MKVSIHVTWTMGACFAVVLLVGLAGCAASGVERALPEGNSQDANGPIGRLQATGVVVNGNPPTNGTPQADDLPSEIVRIRPPQGSQACPSPQVGVDFHLTDGMLKDGSFDLSTVTLTLDGKDVTQKTEVLMPMTSPSDKVFLSYTPTTVLALGKHQASFTYPSASSRSTYEWTFMVADIPCP